MEIKALACELPHQLGLPLSRLSLAEVKREVLRRGLVASIGESTLWRWLSEDAIRPWRHRSWIFPRDPDFGPKAARVLDLYAGCWEGQPLKRDEFVPARPAIATPTAAPRAAGAAPPYAPRCRAKRR